jgi:hypothetical protein
VPQKIFYPGRSRAKIFFFRLLDRLRAGKNDFFRLLDRHKKVDFKITSVMGGGSIFFSKIFFKIKGVLARLFPLKRFRYENKMLKI